MSVVRAHTSTPVLESPLVIASVAVLLRVGFILVFHFYRFSSNPDLFQFGGEMGRVAYALATGKGFSSPCRIPSGPTALVPPMYPYLIALTFKAVRVYSDKSGAILLVFNALCSGLVCLVLSAVGRRTVGTKAATIGAWAWAFWPMALWESHRVWETSLSVLLFALAFLSMLLLQEKTESGFGALCGLLWGLTALTNPAVLAFVLPAARSDDRT
jgi:Dolichyl-phosphate-mannose-protein mannosyltransferase